MTVCNRCGKENQDHYKFCLGCGAELTAAPKPGGDMGMMKTMMAEAGGSPLAGAPMGGMEHGDAASRTAVKAFLEAYQRKTPDEPIPTALERAVRDANQQVVALANNLGMSEGIGTTLVATALTGTSMYFISVGDSGLFHISGGQMQTVNRPHIFANVLDQAVARGSMSREDAENHPERESLTSYIGSGKLTEIDHNQDPWPLLEGDTVLLASDGLFKTLENDEIITCLQGNPQAWAEALVTRTLSKQREYQDNVTVLSVTVESDTSAAIPRTVLMKPPPAVALGSSPNAVPPPRSKAVRPRPGTLDDFDEQNPGGGDRRGGIGRIDPADSAYPALPAYHLIRFISSMLIVSLLR
jgi:protein phosphatase